MTGLSLVRAEKPPNVMEPLIDFTIWLARTGVSGDMVLEVNDWTFWHFVADAEKVPLGEARSLDPRFSEERTELEVYGAFGKITIRRAVT